MKVSISSLLISVLNIAVLILGYSIYLKGFFPIKTSINGVSVRKTFSFSTQTFGHPVGSYDKMVILLVDALRADFVYDDQRRMPFLRTMVDDYRTRNFILKAHLPTVTLPRLKSITTGGIPGFVDVVLNFDTAKLTEDNLVSQLKSSGRKIVFYGDDTWIKLFPDLFDRSDGVTSFFVTDYTEVDNNVTRHLDDELSALDWDVMILHYLGLDHIGHTVGPKSSLVQPKLLEMDNVLQKIYQELEKQADDYRSVILVCGDHGMSDQGGHGGATDSEILVPAVFLSPQYPRDTGNPSASLPNKDIHYQIDLAVTLSILMGTPPPINNLGTVLLDTLQGFKPETILQVLHINAEQVLHLLKANVYNFETERSYELYNYAVQLHNKSLSVDETSPTKDREIMTAYQSAIHAMTEKIARALTKYDMYAMVAGIGLIFMALIFSIQNILSGQGLVTLLDSKKVTAILAIFIGSVFCHVTVCTSQSYSSDLLCGSSVLSVTLQLIFLFVLAWLPICIYLQGNAPGKVYKQWYPASGLSKLLLSGTLLHTLSLVSSSFVEEEHQTWYHFTMSLYTVALVTICYKYFTKLGIKREGKVIITEKSNVTVYGVTSNDKQVYVRNKERRTEQNNEACGDHLCEDKTFSTSSFPWQQVGAVVIVMFIGRLARSINQTGNKWLDQPDLGDWLVGPENKDILVISVNVSLVSIAALKWKMSDVPASVLFVLGLSSIYCYRAVSMDTSNMDKGITEARYTYGIILGMNLLSVWKYLKQKRAKTGVQLDVFHESFHHLQLSWILLIGILLQPHNTLLVAMITLQEELFDRVLVEAISPSPGCLTLLCFWMGEATFYMQGNSNSLSTIDVSAGYVGLDGYQPILVGLLIAASTYAGPLFWFLALVKYLYRQAAVKQGTRAEMFNRVQVSLSEAVKVLTICRGLTLCLYTTLTISQRYHLFVWTVFAPKLLYEGVYTFTIATVSICMIVLCKISA